MPSDQSQLRLDQAWLLIWDSPTSTARTAHPIVAILDQHISSSTMLQIVEQVYVSSCLTPFQQLQYLENKPIAAWRASFVFLNDGSPFEERIVCGEQVWLSARRAYDLALHTDLNGDDYLSWREPHVLVEDDQRVIQYWEEFSVCMRQPGSGQP